MVTEQVYVTLVALGGVFMHINLSNAATQQVKPAKIGFSWTVFFFGCLPPLFRGDWKWFFILLIVEAVFGLPTFGFGAGIIGIIFSFFYNKIYINDLLDHGYQAADDYSREALRSHGFIR